ncbi:MAG: putative lipid II flippase FtsW [Chloroflexi bacterium]|nr:putative lipid II flippase FtsW [Chloroflexota bacterium]
MTSRLNAERISPKSGGLDYPLLLVVGALVVTGLILVYSSSFALAYEAYGNPAYFFSRQAFWAFLGALALLLSLRIDYHYWRKLSIAIFGMTFVLLIIVLIFGEEVNGAKRWFFGGSIQPSELAKLTLVLYMAHWLSSKGEKLRHLTYGLVPFSVLIGLVTGLVILEPDFGTALLLGGSAVVMFFVSGADLKQLGILFLVGGLTLTLLISQTAYARERLETYLSDPLHDPFSPSRYHVAQTLIALGSGGVFGVGLGASQQKLGFLPAPHTDAILAILGEELGLVGSWTVVGLFALLAYRGIHIALRAPDDYGLLLAAGITIWVTLQALMNIGVTTFTIPFTGLPLPFLSFGGSSLVVSLSGIGVLLNISQSAVEKRSRRNEDFALRWGHRRPHLSHPRRP